MNQRPSTLVRMYLAARIHHRVLVVHVQHQHCVSCVKGDRLIRTKRTHQIKRNQNYMEKYYQGIILMIFLNMKINHQLSRPACLMRAAIKATHI